MARSGVIRVAATVVVAASAVALGGGALRAHRRTLTTELVQERDLHAVAHAGSKACIHCHPEHDASWRRTFHRTMTQDVAASGEGEEAVAGDFSGATYRYGDVVARMYRDAAGRFVMSFAKNGERAPAVEAVVARAVGSRRYQQYLAERDGALWRLPMAYHIEEKRWFHMNGAFLTPDPAWDFDGVPPERNAGADDSDRAQVQGAADVVPRFGGGAFDRHVTRWNDNCVFCHNVAANPGRVPDTGAFRTTVAELGIACEACHGPGEAHVRANRDPARRYLLNASGAADPTIVNPSRLSPSAAVDLCGRCHGQRMSDDVNAVLAHGDPFVPGDVLASYSAPLWQDTALRGERGVFAPRFWDDGTPRLTAYEYQGLLQSPCAQRGAMTCTSCHGMHDGDPRGQLRPSAMGDGACTSCHVSMASREATARHSRHLATGAGSRCVSCHMPKVVYGVLDVHPSHRIEIPEPARAIANGRPDACTLCHVDQTRNWAVRARTRLWPRYAVEAGRQSRDDDAFAPADAVFSGDPIFRAVAADALGRAPVLESAAPVGGGHRALAKRAAILLAVMADDRYPGVRHLAARALERVLGASDYPRGVAQTITQTIALVRRFDPTSPPRTRAAVLAELRRALALSPADEPAPTRVAELRARAARVDIDIGE